MSDCSVTMRRMIKIGKMTPCSVAYLRGEEARCDAPPWTDHENYLQATLYQKVRFLPFSSKNCQTQQCLMGFFHIPMQYAIKIAM